MTDTFCPHSDDEPCSICEAFRSFKEAVDNMRSAQKMYFKERDAECLNRCKQLERMVDRMSASLTFDPKQKRLF